MATSVLLRLREAGCVFAEDEARLLGEVATSAEHLEVLVSRRIAGEPLEYLVGFVEFAGERWDIRPGVFIPRQRSELLVEEAARYPGARILDLCCGCGALGRSLQRRIGGSLIGVDVSADALESAQANALSETYRGDLFDALPDDYRAQFAIILANAPYVPTAAIADMPRESRDHEPRSAVDGGSDGMDIQRRILREAGAWLAPSGRLLTETSEEQSSALMAQAVELGWEADLVHDPERGAHVLVVHRAPRPADLASGS